MDMLISVLHFVVLTITWVFAAVGWTSIGIVIAMTQSRSRPVVVKYGAVGFIAGAVVTTLAFMGL